MIDRPDHRSAVLERLKRNPVVAILGARQVGKTTLAREIGKSYKNGFTWFDLEDSRHRARLADPMLALAGLRTGLVVLDEVQRAPEVFQALRVLADRKRGPRFLVLGSASPVLLRQSAESLAGRIALHELPPLALNEVGTSRLDRLWLRGGFPRSYAAKTGAESANWRRDFVRTFLERDIPQLGITIAAATLQRFWSMVAHYHGQTLNLSELGRSLGVADTTIRHYLDILESTFMVKQLLPWHENLGKRQIKAPKLYLSDSGMLHTLLGVDSQESLDVHPKVGASWEGFCLSSVLATLRARPEECFFWGTHSGAELDLLVVSDGKRRGFEIKRTSSPALTPSMRLALGDLRLDSLDVIYAGEDVFPLAPNVRAVGAAQINAALLPVRNLP